MATAMSAADVAAKWSRNLLANKSSITAGINAVTESPTEKAAKAQQAYADGCAEAASSGRFAAGCRAVSLEDWRSAAINKGLRNLDTGVKAAEPKMTKFMEQYLPFVQQTSAQIQRMPKGSRSDAMARIQANLDALDQFKKQRRR